MAWIKTYQVPFQSLAGTQYMVYILEKGNTQGTITTLTGAASPFVTSEDYDDNIYIPIRKQTGYLRVIDETSDGSLLENLMPVNNTQKMVKLVTGTWNNDFTAFTDGNVQWQGFLCAEAFTQPWDNQKKVLEFPVKSVLAALEDVQIPDYYAGDETRCATILTRAVQSLLGPSVTPYSDLYIVDDAAYRNNWLIIRVMWGAFFSEQTIENEGSNYTQIIGGSYYDALSAICSTFGLSARENGTIIYFAHYDVNTPFKCEVLRYTWTNVQYIASELPYSLTIESSDIPSADMLTSLIFKDNDNHAGFSPGARNAIVTLNLGGLSLNINLPNTEETPDEPVEFVLHTGKLYIQPHGPRTESEVFSYYEYKRNQLQGTSTYEDTENATVYNGYYAIPYYDASWSLFAGAFPIRWFYQENTERIVLKNGLYLNTQYRQSQDTPGSITMAEMYQIDSPIGIDSSDGWIRIDFKWLNIIWNITLGKYLFTDAASFYRADVKSEITMCLRIGDKWWNGSNWVSNGSTSSTRFFFNVKNDTIVTNKTSDINVDEEGGYFIPISEPLSGSVSFFILNFVPVTTVYSNYEHYEYCYSHILYDLSIKHLRPISIVASERTKNTYRQEILQSGFKDDKIIELSIGTFNNNTPSVVFLKQNTTDYLDIVTYHTTTSTTDVRPEIHLLNRMAVQYNQVRRTFIGIIQRGIEVMKTRYTYLGRKFMGIKKQTDWRNDVEEVKFIEVN